MRDPFRGAYLIAPAWNDNWRSFDRQLENQLINATRASKY
jgi:hypothetical protein